MPVCTKALLPGSPGYEEIVQAIESAFGVEVEIRPECFEPTGQSYFYLSFPDPDADLERVRQMMVWPNTPDRKDVCAIPATYCSLGASGSSVRIVRALAEKFGGHILESDSNDDWYFVEGAEPASMAELSPEDAFNLEISHLMPAAAALAIREAVSNPFVLDRLGLALDQLRQAKEEQAMSETPGM